MRVFAAVVDAASFVAAGDSLGISKAAVSSYVSELERRLGVRLMHRTTRRLSLTPERELFLARCSGGEAAGASAYLSGSFARTLLASAGCCHRLAF